MIKALIRYIFFVAPVLFLSGLVLILFDKKEVLGGNFTIRRQWRPDIKKQVLESYLNKCYKVVSEENNGKKNE